MSRGMVLLLLLDLASAASRKSSQGLENNLTSLTRSHLADSRLSPDLMSAAKRYQIHDIDNFPIDGAAQNRLGERPGAKLPNYWFKVCTKCPKYTWFLRNLEEREAAAEEAVRTALIHLVVLQTLEEGLTQQHTRS